MTTLEKSNEALRHAYVQGGDKAAFHLCAPVGWINDPNGFSHFGGNIHLFFQFYPYEPKWGPMHWGHCITQDMVRWQQLPVAMAPDQPYETGCFSGTAIEADGKHVLVYTSHFNLELEQQSIAIGDGLTYEKHPQNPVIRASDLPEGLCPDDFRDPKVWRENGKYRLVAGGRDQAGLGKIVLYESEDLLRWQYVGVVEENDGSLGTMWECPDFFPLDGKQVLMCSPIQMQTTDEFHDDSGTMALIGTWDGSTFTRESVQAVDSSRDFYAQQSTLLPDGRRVMIAWLRNRGMKAQDIGKDWNGMMTFPRELFLRDGRMCQWPIREIETYYTEHIRKEGVAQDAHLADGRQLDMMLRVEKAEIFTLDVAADDKHATRIIYDATNRRLTVEREGRSLESALLHQTPEAAELRILMDKYSVEIFANGGAEALTVTHWTDLSARAVRLHAPKPVKYTFDAHVIEVDE